jgi:hypothetical protein
MRTTLLGLALAATALAATAAPAHAQMIWGGEYERAMRPGAYIPHDAEPWSHRYHFTMGPNIYINGNGWQLWHLEYLDRVERARKFGYAPPPPPKYGLHPDIIEGEVIEVVVPEGAAGNGVVRESVVREGVVQEGETIVEEVRPVRTRIGFGLGFGRFRR